ncbi:hypothetical protein FVF58_05390 [Paraburkholderia panacisoli]|uniref:Uncharacterized protein n=2 Tax=Paraburkholderia panacisoli TaxID=2603818 RepID=A0A5B0HH45_9BURK|nr:hypothetical protein FVF58_05390 [Paraburkholderia panacisoli]
MTSRTRPATTCGRSADRAMVGQAASLVRSAVASFVAFKLAVMTIGLRVEQDREREGLDFGTRGEDAYHS